jgi:hypothetical protein
MIRKTQTNSYQHAFKNYLMELGSDLVNNSDLWTLKWFNWVSKAFVEINDITKSRLDSEYLSLNFERREIKLIEKGLFHSGALFENENCERLIFDGLILDSTKTLDFNFRIDSLRDLGNEIITFSMFEFKELAEIFPILIAMEGESNQVYFDNLTKIIKSNVKVFNSDRTLDRTLWFDESPLFTLSNLQTKDANLNKIIDQMMKENLPAIIQSIYSDFESSILFQTEENLFPERLELIQSGLNYYNNFLKAHSAEIKKIKKSDQSISSLKFATGLAFAGSILGRKLPLEAWSFVIDSFVNSKGEINIGFVEKLIFKKTKLANIDSNTLDFLNNNKELKIEFISTFLKGISDAFYKLKGFKLKVVSVFPYPHQAKKSEITTALTPILFKTIMDSNHPLFDFDSIFYANNLMGKSFNSLSGEVSSAIKEVMNSNYFTFVDPKITSYFEGGIPD